MKSRLLYGMIASLVIVMVTIGIGLMTDAPFVDVLHYRYVGQVHKNPTLYLLNYDDTAFVLSRSYPTTWEFIKVAWNGDTVERSGEMPVKVNWFRPHEEVSGYDSTIIRVGGQGRVRYVVPVSTGRSDLITKAWWDPREVFFDTLKLSVRLQGERLVIEGEKVHFYSTAPHDTSASISRRRE